MYRKEPLKSDAIEPAQNRSLQNGKGVYARTMARRCLSNGDIESTLRDRAQSPQGAATRSSSVSPTKWSLAATNGVEAVGTGSTGARGTRLCELHSSRASAKQKVSVTRPSLAGAKIAKPVVRPGKPPKVSTQTPGRASQQNGQLTKMSPTSAEQDGERIINASGSSRPTQANGKVPSQAPEQASKQNGQLSKMPTAEQEDERAPDAAESPEFIPANDKISTLASAEQDGAVTAAALVGSGPIQANNNVPAKGPVPAPEQASKQNGQLPKAPNTTPHTSAGNIQSGSGGGSNPPSEDSAPVEKRVTLDSNYCKNLLATEPFGNPYKLAALLADNIQKFSKVSISAGTVYSLLCNSLLSELMGGSYIPGVLRPKVTRTVCKFARSVDFQRGRAVVDEVRSARLITVNRYAAGAISVDSYTYGVDVASRMRLNAQVFQDLLSTSHTPVSPESIAAKSVANTVLRFIFSYLVHLESLKRSSPQEEEADATVLSILEYLDDEYTNIHDILHAGDYQGFYQYMKHLIARDAHRVNSLLLSTEHKASVYMAEHYNALLSNIIAYQCVRAGVTSGPETRDVLERIGKNATQHLMPLLRFSTTLSSVVAKLYNAINREGLIHAMNADGIRLIMESQDFKSALIENVAPVLRKVMPPLEVQSRYNQENLEKIAAAIFIFYPGCSFDGSDIMLDGDGLKLLNVGEGKIRTSHDFFDEEEASRAMQRPDILLAELQTLFWGFRASAGPLKWKEFLLELNELCETMITSQFAVAAQSKILSSLSGIQHLRQLHERMGQVVYESFLPRVLYIREFLRNGRLAESAACLIDFLPGPSATSGELSRLLLRIYNVPIRVRNVYIDNFSQACSITPYGISDYQEPGASLPLSSCESAFKAAIDEHAHHFLSRFQSDNRENVVERRLEDELSRDPETQYRPLRLSEQQRHAIVKTAARRSIAQRAINSGISKMWLYSIGILALVIAVFLVQVTPPYVFVPYMVLVAGFLGFVAGRQYISKDASVEHCMSIAQVPTAVVHPKP
ncbi:hypothetical protein DOS86_05150, partial [Anaplasma marginale]